MSENLPMLWDPDDEGPEEGPRMAAVEFDPQEWARTGGVPISWIELREDFRDMKEGHHLDAPGYIPRGGLQVDAYHCASSMLERECEEC